MSADVVNQVDNEVATESASRISDPVSHPAHYAEGWSNGAELIDITENLNFNRGNAVKYIARAGKKDPEKELEDLQKAEFYLQREIARIDPLAEYVDIGFCCDEDQLSFWELELQVPRIWISLEDVPTDVRVIDTSGDVWEYKLKDSIGEYRWHFGGCPVESDQKYLVHFDGDGPFTEVVE